MTSFGFRLMAGGAALAAAVALSGCSAATKDDRPAGQQSSQPASPSADAHNGDDVMFAQMMIPHHEQAVALSALVPERSTDPAVVALAAAIAGEQQPEIEFMASMLEQWGVTAGGHTGMDMAGMVDADTMARLQTLRGRDFDTLWLQSMIAHHRGAVEMADAEVKAGRNPEMTGLARGIIAAQQAEINQMTKLLGR